MATPDPHHLSLSLKFNWEDLKTSISLFLSAMNSDTGNTSLAQKLVFRFACIKEPFDMTYFIARTIRISKLGGYISLVFGCFLPFANETFCVRSERECTSGVAAVAALVQNSALHFGNSDTRNVVLQISVGCRS